jgi:hypothetical protein
MTGNTAGAASILMDIPFNAATRFPETIPRCYKFLKRSNRPAQTKTYLANMFSASTHTAAANVPLAELSLARPGKGLWHRLGISRDIPPILISTISKSGSTFLPRVLCDRLVIPSTKIFVEIAEHHHRELMPAALKKFATGGVLCRQHFHPDERVLRQLSEAGIDRILFHIRDPRQALISWVFYMESVLRKHTAPCGSVMGISPFQYGRMNLEQKIDFHIDRFFVRTMDLIEAWLDAKQARPYGVRIRFTRFEDMVNHPQAFFDEVLAFFGVRENRFFSTSWRVFRQVLKRRPALKKRSGKKDEWKSILTPAQQQKVTALTPSRVRALFPEHDWSFDESP